MWPSSRECPVPGGSRSHSKFLLRVSRLERSGELVRKSPPEVNGQLTVGRLSEGNRRLSVRTDKSYCPYKEESV